MSPIVNGNGNGKSPRRGAPGFTLIELVIVMVIMIIVVSIVSPRLQVSPTRQVQGMARQMVAHLELARSHALGQRQMTRIVFDEASRNYTAYVDDDRDDVIDGDYTEVTAFPEFGVRDLERLIDYGRGNASKIPGDPGDRPVTLTEDASGISELNLSVQGVPEPWGTMGTVYLVHRDDSDIVAAISMASSGSFKAWRWQGGEWR